MRLEIQVNPDAPPLRAGMTVAVNIDTGQERDVYALLEDLMGTATAMGLPREERVTTVLCSEYHLA